LSRVGGRITTSLPRGDACDSCGHAGLMLESFLVAGAQPLAGELVYGHQ
jgi:3-deoxy-D-arabino-heptulosonate 7-phosphate (DAHP) synthase